MFVMAMVGGVVSIAFAINGADKALDGGMMLLRAARADGAREGIKQYRDGPELEAKKSSFEHGYKAGVKDVRGLLGL